MKEKLTYLMDRTLNFRADRGTVPPLREVMAAVGLIATALTVVSI